MSSFAPISSCPDHVILSAAKDPPAEGRACASGLVTLSVKNGDSPLLRSGQILRCAQDDMDALPGDG